MSRERREANQSRILFFRNRCKWLEPSAPIHHEVAEGLIAMSDRWRKADGTVIESPGMADHVVKSRSGWCIKYGANVFHVEQAIRLAAKELRAAYDRLLGGVPVDLARLERQIQDHFSSTVSHETTGRYPHYARVDHDLVFGTHFIDTVQAARFLIAESGLTSAMEPDRPRRQQQASRAISSHGQGALSNQMPRQAKETGPASAAGPALPKRPKMTRGGTFDANGTTSKEVAALRARERDMQAFVDLKFRQLRSTYPILATNRTLRRRARRVLVEIFLRTGPDGASVPDSIVRSAQELTRDLVRAGSDRHQAKRGATSLGNRIDNGLAE